MVVVLAIDVIHVSYTANNLKPKIIIFKVMAKFCSYFSHLDYCLLCLGRDIFWMHLKKHTQL